MEAFLNRHASNVIGVLSGFDRLVFRGTLRMLAYHLGMKAYLWAEQVLLKDFASHAEAVTEQLRAASEAAARRSGRPIEFCRRVPPARKTSPGRPPDRMASSKA